MDERKWSWGHGVNLLDPEPGILSAGVNPAVFIIFPYKSKEINILTRRGHCSVSYLKYIANAQMKKEEFIQICS